MACEFYLNKAVTKNKWTEFLIGCQICLASESMFFPPCHAASSCGDTWHPNYGNPTAHLRWVLRVVFTVKASERRKKYVGVWCVLGRLHSWHSLYEYHIWTEIHEYMWKWGTDLSVEYIGYGKRDQALEKTIVKQRAAFTQ